MELILVPLPAICEPDPLVYCDTDNDGIGEFTLTDADDQIRCGDPSGNLVVTYHETQGGANANTNALDSPYLNIVPFSQIVFARISDLATGCYDTVAFELIVGDSPVINAPDPILLCDDDGDGIEIFDLTSAASQILAGLTGGPYVVEYFETQPNADSGTNPIVNEMVYPNQPSLGSPQIIYIVVTDTTNGCSSQTTLELQVNLMPAITAPDPLILCETSTPPDGIESFDLTQVIAQITGGDTNILITFFETQIDADANANVIADPTAFENQISNPQDVFIRAEDLTTSCIETSFTLEIRVENAPSPATPDPLVVCDDNNDGYAFFTLTDREDEIINNEPNVILSYHETVIDAENSTNALDVTMDYSNIIQFMQTIFVRAVYNPVNMGNGCYSIVNLDLIVIDSPVVPLSLDDLIACDDEDMDGFSIFDLTQQNITIYGDQDPDDFTLTYHLAEMDALDGAPIIASPTMYENTSNPQTIWYRLDNNDADNFCSATGSFMLQVVDGPEIIDLDPITVCDDLGQENDGITIFDLTIYDDLIANGVAGLSVQYFLTPEGSQANEDPISPANEHMNVDDMGNAINPQNIFVRVLDTNSGCVGFTILELRVAPNPDPITDVTLELCDDTNSGDEEEIFDLTEAEALIIGGAPWDVQYFETYEDAFDMMNGIPDPTMYINPTNPASIFVLVTNNDTGCFEIVAVQLIVNPLPDDTAVLTSLVVCETPNDGVAEFDLTLKKDEALGPDQDPADFEVSYYETALDAEMMVNPITPANMYPATIIPGMPLLIYTGITNLETGCYIGGVQFFELETRDGATATTPAEPYTLCDTEGANDGFTVFDLSTLDDEILGVQDPTIYGVLYYETLENALEGIDPITPKTSYTNIINPQEIYATLTNALSECSETVVVILNVEQLPFFELPETFRLCVDENGNPIQEDSGEESPPTFGIDLDENLYVFEWTLDGAVLEGEIGNTITAVAGGVYQVTATEIATGCSAMAMTTVTLSAPPINFSARLVDGAFSGSNTVEVVTEGIGTYEYSIGDGPFQESAIFENVVAGSQMITIRDVNGCGEATFKFGVIDYDRFMTPNGDGFNDTWNIESIASFDLTANIYIFDRFGKLLKQLSPLNDLGWDGTYNGAAMPSSDYWFLIEYTEDDTRKEFRSHFTLKR
jgi:gliding motility-associated-like protein